MILVRSDYQQAKYNGDVKIEFERKTIEGETFGYETILEWLKTILITRDKFNNNHICVLLRAVYISNCNLV